MQIYLAKPGGPRQGPYTVAQINADLAARSHLSADANDEVLGDFGVIGVWLYDSGTWTKVTSVIEEMRIVLFHSGYSTVLRESEDGSELDALAAQLILQSYFQRLSETPTDSSCHVSPHAT